MKKNSKYEHLAIVRTAIDLTSMKSFAEAVVDEIAGVEVSDVKGTGIVLRKDDGVVITDDMIIEGIVDGVCALISDVVEDATEYIAENYDFVYDDENINQEVMAEIFDITRSGRLIYVELDD